MALAAATIYWLKIKGLLTIDTMALRSDHARQLIEVQHNVGTFVVISSSSVYRDALGRTLDEAMENVLPDPCRFRSAYRGTSRFHTTSVANITALTRVAMPRPFILDVGAACELGYSPATTMRKPSS
jgi:hypothetical protein